MNNITFEVNSAGNISPDNISLGRAGEHKFTKLNFNLDANLGTIDYYRIGFNDFYTVNLTPSNGVITYSVPQEVMKEGVVLIQLDGYKFDSNASAELIFKSSTIYACVERSIDTKRDLPTGSEVPIESAITTLNRLTESAQSLKTAVEAAAQSAKEDSESADTSAREANNSAIKAAQSALACAGAVSITAEAKDYRDDAEASRTFAEQAAYNADVSQEAASTAAASAKSDAESAKQDSEKAAACKTATDTALKECRAIKYNVAEKADGSVVDRNCSLSDNNIRYKNADTWQDGTLSVNGSSLAVKKTPCPFKFDDKRYRILIECEYTEDSSKTAPYLYLYLAPSKCIKKQLTLKYGYAYADIDVSKTLSINMEDVSVSISTGSSEIALTPNGNTIIYDYGNLIMDDIYTIFPKNFSPITELIPYEKWIPLKDSSGNDIGYEVELSKTLSGVYKIVFSEYIETPDGSNLPTFQFLKDGAVLVSKQTEAYGVYGEPGADVDFKDSTTFDKFRLMFAETDPIQYGFLPSFDGMLKFKPISMGALAGRATTLSGYGITDAYTKSQTDAAISDAVASAISSALNTEV